MINHLSPGEFRVPKLPSAVANTRHFVSDLLYERRYHVRTSGRLILDVHDAESICYSAVNWRLVRMGMLSVESACFPGPNVSPNSPR